jgi:hypothetical protein
MNQVQGSVIQCLSPQYDDEMSDDTDWAESAGAFPRGGPIKRKSEQEQEYNHIFVDDAFDGSYESLAIVYEGSRETHSSSQDGLISVSMSSSDVTPATSNTASAVRDALKKKKLQKTPVAGNQTSSSGFYPFNIYKSLSKDKEERQDRSEAKITKITTTNGGGADKVEQPKKDREQATTAYLPHVMEDENSSVITDDHQENSQYVMEGVSVHHPMSVMSARSRRHGGGSKHHFVRHTLPTSQQVTANPSSMLKNLFICIEQERHMHRLSAQHFRAVHNWCLFLPSILITLASGLTVLIFQADLKTNNDMIRVYSSIAVGVGSLISVFWQALSKQLDLGVRGALHDAASMALKRLSDDILLTLSSAETIPAEYVALMGEKCGQAVDSCTSNVPYKLDAAFSAMSDRMVFMFRPPMGQAPRKNLRKMDFIRLYTTAFDELSAEIISFSCFPLALPNPRRASDSALRNFKTIITEGKEVDRRRHCTRWICPCLGVTDEERSLFDVLPAVSIAEPQSNTNGAYAIRSFLQGTEV